MVRPQGRNSPWRYTVIQRDQASLQDDQNNNEDQMYSKDQLIVSSNLF